MHSKGFTWCRKVYITFTYFHRMVLNETKQTKQMHSNKCTWCWKVYIAFTYFHKMVQIGRTSALKKVHLVMEKIHYIYLSSLDKLLLFIFTGYIVPIEIMSTSKKVHFVLESYITFIYLHGIVSIVKTNASKMAHLVLESLYYFRLTSLDSVKDECI